MSVATTASTSTISTAPLPVKKVRATAAAKKDAPKGPKTKKAATGAAKNGSKSSSPTRPQPSRAAVKTEGDDLDNITSGIKKITLLTKQQKEARAREKKRPAGGKQALSSGGSQTSSLPVTPGEERPQEFTVPFSSGDQPSATSPAFPPEVPQQEIPITPFVNIVEEDAMKVEPRADPPSPEQPTTDVFVQYQPGGPAPETITPQGPLNWLPVNSTATPSPGKQTAPATTPSPAKEEERAIVSPSPMKRGEMPVFTPTSQLRFAPRAGQQSSALPALPTLPGVKAEAPREVDGAVWEVPETSQ